MGALSQARFDKLVTAGCTCGGRLLEIRSFFAALAGVLRPPRGLRPRRRFAPGELAQTRAGSRLRRIPRGSST